MPSFYFSPCRVEATTLLTEMWDLSELEKTYRAAKRKQKEDDAERARIHREAASFFAHRIERWTEQVNRLEAIDTAICCRSTPETQDRLTGGIRHRIRLLRAAIGDQRITYADHEEESKEQQAEEEQQQPVVGDPAIILACGGGGSWADEE